MFNQLVWFAASCICVVSLLFRKKLAQLRNHENPNVQGVGRLDAHVIIAAFSNEQEARTKVMQQKCSPNVIDLGGIWKFKLFKSLVDCFRYRTSEVTGENPDPACVVPGTEADDCAECVGSDRKAVPPTANIVVPGSWQLQYPGDLPIYTNAGYIASIDNVTVPCENPTGYYSTEFTIPAKWSSRRVVLSFAGVDSAYYLFVNKKYVGFSKDSRLPAEFDITSVAKFGVLAPNSCDQCAADAAQRTNDISATSTSAAASAAADARDSMNNTGAVGGGPSSGPAAGGGQNQSQYQQQTHSNFLEVIVVRISDGLLFENQDMWNLSGIFRDVLLVSYPLPLHIFDYSWKIGMELSAYALTQESLVHTKVKIMWDMWAVENLLRIREKNNQSSNQDSCCEHATDSGGECASSNEGNENFDGDSSRSTSHYSQLQEDWLLCVSIYDEGCLVCSTHNNLARTFTFENSFVKDPILTQVSSIPLPLNDDEAAENGDEDRDKFSFNNDNDDGTDDLGASSHGDNHAGGSIHGNDSTHGGSKSNGGRKKRKKKSYRYKSSGKSLNEHSDKRYLPVTLHQKLNVKNPKYWRPEKPYIYTLVVSIRNAITGEVLQAESCHFGLRTVTRYDGLLCVNNQPILIRGVNYSEFNPIGGHTCSPDLQEADIKLMKRNNINAVRTSHYPQTNWFYELCNVYGLYVIDEANIETHGLLPAINRLANNPMWYDSYTQRVSRMIERDKVHVCVIGWSLGHDSGYGEVHDLLAEYVRKRDPSRIVLYEPASYGPRDVQISKTMATDVLFPMYSGIDDCVKFANMFPDMPLILSAYSHSMGNSGGNLADYWTAFLNYPRLQGGFIWDWVDQGLSLTDGSGRPLWGYSGDFGENFFDNSSLPRGEHGLSRLAGAGRDGCTGLTTITEYYDEKGRRKGSATGIAVNGGRSVGPSHRHGLCGLNFPDRGLGYKKRGALSRVLSKSALLLQATAALNASAEGMGKFIHSSKANLLELDDFPSRSRASSKQSVGRSRSGTADSGGTVSTSALAARSRRSSSISASAASHELGTLAHLAATHVAATGGLSPLSYWTGTMRAMAILKVVNGLSGSGQVINISGSMSKNHDNSNTSATSTTICFSSDGTNSSKQTGLSAAGGAGNGAALSVDSGVNVDAALAKPALLEAKQCMKRFSAMANGFRVNCSGFRGILQAASTRRPFANPVVSPGAVTNIVKDYKRIVNPAVQPPASPGPGLSLSNASISINSASTPPASSSCMSAMKASVRVNLCSNTDYNGDILSDYSFAGVLLCDGLVVGCSRVNILSVEYTDVNGKEKVVTVESSVKGRCTVQQLNCKIDFNIPTMVVDKNIVNGDEDAAKFRNSGAATTPANPIDNAALFASFSNASSSTLLTKSHCASFFSNQNIVTESKTTLVDDVIRKTQSNDLEDENTMKARTRSYSDGGTSLQAIINESLNVRDDPSGNVGNGTDSTERKPRGMSDDFTGSVSWGNTGESTNAGDSGKGPAKRILRRTITDARMRARADLFQARAKSKTKSLLTQPIVVFGLPWQQDLLLEQSCFENLMISLDDGDAIRNGFWTRISSGNTSTSVISKLSAVKDVDSNNPSTEGGPQEEHTTTVSNHSGAPPTEWSVVIIGRLSDHTPYAPAGFPMGFSVLRLSDESINQSIEEQLDSFVASGAEKGTIHNKALEYYANSAGKSPDSSVHGADTKTGNSNSSASAAVAPISVTVTAPESSAHESNVNPYPQFEDSPLATAQPSFFPEQLKSYNKGEMNPESNGSEPRRPPREGSPKHRAAVLHSTVFSSSIPADVALSQVEKEKSESKKILSSPQRANRKPISVDTSVAGDASSPLGAKPPTQNERTVEVKWDTTPVQTFSAVEDPPSCYIDVENPHNIMLRAFLPGESYAKGIATSSNPTGGDNDDDYVVEAVISSDTGMLLSYCIDGTDVFQSSSTARGKKAAPEAFSEATTPLNAHDRRNLFGSADKQSVPGQSNVGRPITPAVAPAANYNACNDFRIQPSRIHIHRAVIDNDDKGYLSRWEACGISKEMLYYLNAPCNNTPSSLDDSYSHPQKQPIELVAGEFYDFNGISVKRIEEYVDMVSSLSSSGPTNNAAASCSSAGGDCDSSGENLNAQVNGMSRSRTFSRSNFSGTGTSSASTKGALMARGVEVYFETKPMEVNNVKIAIIKRLQAFADDPVVHQMFIVARNSKEELFIHQLAASLRFGRESISLGKSQTSSQYNWSRAAASAAQNPNAYGGGSAGSRYTPGFSGPQTAAKRKPMGITVKLWKPQLYKCSTTPKAEALVIGPFGVPDEEVIPYESSDSPASSSSSATGSGSLNHNDNSGGSNAFEMSSTSTIMLSWTLKYLMTAAGELKIRVHVDTSSLPVPTPRMGMQFNIRKDLQQIIYKGNGPHECYPDRKASTIHAVHKALVDELYVPYIRPTENGSRTDVQWCQFRQNRGNYVAKAIPTSSYYGGNASSTASSSSTLSSEGAKAGANAGGRGRTSSADSKSTSRSSLPEGPGGAGVPTTPVRASRYESSRSANSRPIGLLVYCTNSAQNKELFNGSGSSAGTPLDTGNTHASSVAAIAKSNSVFSSHATNSNAILSDFQDNVNTASTGRRGLGGSIVAPTTKLFNFSAQRYTTEDLALSTHSSEIELFPRPFIALNIDPYIMGLGGDDGWSASVHEEHLLNPGIYTFDINMSLFYTSS